MGLAILTIEKRGVPCRRTIECNRETRSTILIKRERPTKVDVAFRQLIECPERPTKSALGLEATLTINFRNDQQKCEEATMTS